MSNKLGRYAPLLLFAILPAILFPEVVFHGKVYVGDADRPASVIPMLQLAADAFRQKSLPFWNSYVLCGYNALGQVFFHPFYPLRLGMLLLFPSNIPAADTWRILLDLFIEMSLWYFFFLKVWRDRALAVFSVVSATLSISTISWLSLGELPGMFAPAILYVLWDWPLRKMRLNVAYLALALFLQIAHCNNQFTMYILIFMLAISTVRCLGDSGLRKGPLLRLVWLWIAALSLAVMLDAFEVIPLIAAQHESARGFISYLQTIQWYGEPAYLALRFALPYFLDNSVVVENNLWISWNEPFFVYTGVISFLFAIVALRKPLRRDVAPWVLAVVLISMCSLRTPFMIVPYLFFAKMHLAHNRLYVLIPICLAFLAPAGLRLFLRSPRDFQKGCVWQTGIIVAVVYLAASGVLGHKFWLLSWLPTQTWTFPTTMDVRAHFAETAVIFLAAGLVAVLAMALYAWELVGERTFKFFCVLILIVDLLFIARRYALLKHFTEDSNWYPANEVTRFLDQLPDRERYRFYLLRGPAREIPPSWPTLSSNSNMVYKVRDAGGYMTFLSLRYALLSNKGSSGGVRVTPDRFVDTPQLADLLGVKYFVGRNAPEFRAAFGSFAKSLFESPETVVLGRERAVARFHLACRAGKTPDSAKDFLRTLHSSGVDLSDTVFLEEDAVVARWSHERCGHGPAGTLDMQEVRPGLLRGKARLSRPAILVVTESFDSGWRASLNGSPLRIHRANYNFQAVELPAGESDVEFIFRFKGFEIAVACVILSIVSVGCLIFWPWS